MFNKLKKVTAVITAGALMATTFALGGIYLGDGNIVRASEILDFDSASSVNYSTILGRAVDFGIVSAHLIQENHMETTFATNLYERTGGPDGATCDVDLAGNAPAQFIISAIGPGSSVKFGKTYNDEDMLFTIYTTQQVIDDELVKIDESRFHGDRKFVAMGYDELVSNVDGIIDHIQTESDNLRNKTPLDLSTVSSVDQKKVTIDLTNEIYKGAALYINVEPGSVLEAAIAGSDDLIIKKDPSTVVVFNMLGSGELTLGQYTVEAGGESYNTTTTHSGEESEHNKFVDKQIARKIIFNVPNASKVNFNNTAGTFILPNPSTDTHVAGSSAGWVASAGTMRVDSAEWHYVYHDRSKDVNDGKTTSFHFASYKAFTKQFDGLNTEKLSDVYAGAGEFVFSFTETKSDFTTPVPGGVSDDDVKTDETGRLTFPIIEYTNADVDPLVPVYRYFVIKELPSTGATGDVHLSTGEIDITVKAVNDNGNIKIYVNSVKYATDAKTNEDIIAVNDLIDQGIAMSGAEFSLGGFYNEIDYNTGSLKLSKSVILNNCNGPVERNQYDNNTTYKIAVKKGPLYVQDLDGNVGSTAHYFELKRDDTITINNLLVGEYTIVEETEDIYHFNFVSNKITVDGSETDTFDITKDHQSDANVENTYEYVDFGGKVSLSITKDANGLSAEYSEKEYDVAVELLSNSIWGTQQIGYVSSINGGISSTPVFFHIKDGETLTINGIPRRYNNGWMESDVIYQVFEGKDCVKVDGYTFSTPMSEYGDGYYSGYQNMTALAPGQSGYSYTVVNNYERDKGNLVLSKSFLFDNAADDTLASQINKDEIVFTITGPSDFGTNGTMIVKYSDARFVDGVLTLNNIPTGNYSVVETIGDSSAPDGYSFDSSTMSASSFELKKGETENVDVTNKYTKDLFGTLNFTKTVSVNDGSVDKTEFKIAIRNSSHQYYDFVGGFSADPVYTTVTKDTEYSYTLPVDEYTIIEDEDFAKVDGYDLTYHFSDWNDKANVSADNPVSKTLINEYTKRTEPEYELSLSKTAVNAPYSNTVYEIAVKTADGRYLRSDGTLGNSGDEYYFQLSNGDSITVPVKNAGTFTVVEKTENQSENNHYTLKTTYSQSEVTLNASNVSDTVAVTNTYTHDETGSSDSAAAASDSAAAASASDAAASDSAAAASDSAAAASDSAAAASDSAAAASDSAAAASDSAVAASDSAAAASDSAAAASDSAVAASDSAVAASDSAAAASDSAAAASDSAVAASDSAAAASDSAAAASDSAAAQSDAAASASAAAVSASAAAASASAAAASASAAAASDSAAAASDSAAAASNSAAAASDSAVAASDSAAAASNSAAAVSASAAAASSDAASSASAAAVSASAAAASNSAAAASNSAAAQSDAAASDSAAAASNSAAAVSASAAAQSATAASISAAAASQSAAVASNSAAAASDSAAAASNSATAISASAAAQSATAASISAAAASQSAAAASDSAVAASDSAAAASNSATAISASAAAQSAAAASISAAAASDSAAAASNSAVVASNSAAAASNSAAAASNSAAASSDSAAASSDSAAAASDSAAAASDSAAAASDSAVAASDSAAAASNSAAAASDSAAAASDSAAAASDSAAAASDSAAAASDSAAAASDSAAAASSAAAPSDYQMQLNKHDQYDQRVVHAVLSIESQNHTIDLSNVVVLQNGQTAENFKLSDDKMVISFTTISQDDAFVYNLPAGDYYITESIVPDGYAKADQISFTVDNNGTVSGVYVQGTPQAVFNREVLMLDKADPSASQPSSKAVPATGEDASLYIALGSVFMVVSAGIVIHLVRSNKKREDQQ